MPSLSTPPRDIASEHKFDSLFADHYLAVYRYCLRRLGPADSEDAAAEVFAVGNRAPRAIRICLAAARSRDELRRGLTILAQLAHGQPDFQLAVV